MLLTFLVLKYFSVSRAELFWHMARTNRFAIKFFNHLNENFTNNILSPWYCCTFLGQTGNRPALSLWIFNGCNHFYYTMIWRVTRVKRKLKLLMWHFYGNRLFACFPYNHEKIKLLTVIPLINLFRFLLLFKVPLSPWNLHIRMKFSNNVKSKPKGRPRI